MRYNIQFVDLDVNLECNSKERQVLISEYIKKFGNIKNFIDYVLRYISFSKSDIKEVKEIDDTTKRVQATPD